MKAGNPRADFLRFYYIHFFSRRNPSLPYGCTATKRIFDDSAHFYLIHFGGLLKKADRKSHSQRFLPSIKFSPAFWGRRRYQERVALVALRRARNLCHGVFFLIAFSFAPAYAKEKADEEFNILFSAVCDTWTLSCVGHNCMIEAHTEKGRRFRLPFCIFLILLWGELSARCRQ